jgi:hypothetical protein
MKKSLLFFVVFVFTVNVFSQSSQNLNASFGLLSPVSNFNGFAVSVGYEKQLSKSLSIYFYTGELYWNYEDLPFGYNPINYAISARDFTVYPFYCGARFLLSTYKSFKVYTGLELGYNYMTYTSYPLQVYEDPITHQNDYYSDTNRKEKITENMFGFGVGLGVSHLLTNKAGFLVEIKRNMLFERTDLYITRYTLNCGLFYNL